MSKTAIRTTYAGVNFRSRLEASWAAFFDLCGWRWEYEPVDLAGWIPDFYLFDIDGNPLPVEVKPIEWNNDIVDIAISDSSLDKVRTYRGPVLILGAFPPENKSEYDGKIGVILHDKIGTKDVVGYLVNDNMAWKGFGYDSENHYISVGTTSLAHIKVHKQTGACNLITDLSSYKLSHSYFGADTYPEVTRRWRLARAATQWKGTRNHTQRGLTSLITGDEDSTIVRRREIVKEPLRCLSSSDNEIVLSMKSGVVELFNSFDNTVSLLGDENIYYSLNRIFNKPYDTARWHNISWNIMRGIQEGTVSAKIIFAYNADITNWKALALAYRAIFDKYKSAHGSELEESGSALMHEMPVSDEHLKSFCSKSGAYIAEYYIDDLLSRCDDSWLYDWEPDYDEDEEWCEEMRRDLIDFPVTDEDRDDLHSLLGWSTAGFDDL